MEPQSKRKRKIQKRAYAKINLFLDILGKRNDGFHEIRTVFSQISLYDEIIFTLTKNQGIKIWSFPKIVSEENNIIYRIAVFIKENYRVNFGVEISLKKNIPVQAGLGGGSSDAASTIAALNELWKLNLSEAEMHGIAEKFGSDINFFLQGGTALGTGRGEKIVPFKEDILLDNLLLIKPSFGISTQKAYALAKGYEYNFEKWDRFISDANDYNNFYNAFEHNILEEYSEIRNIFDKIKQQNARPLLSGSGSTVIAFCKDLITVEKLKEYFSNNYWTYITKTMRRRK